MVENRLLVRGPGTQGFIRRCSDKTISLAGNSAEMKCFTLNSLRPVPLKMIEERPDIVPTWCKEYWGTAADVVEAGIWFQGDMAGVIFKTIDTPADQWVYDVSRLFPNLEFQLVYIDKDKGICGELCCSNAFIRVETSFDGGPLYEKVLTEMYELEMDGTPFFERLAAEIESEVN